jgi:hypothetical protein
MQMAMDRCVQGVLLLAAAVGMKIGASQARQAKREDYVHQAAPEILPSRAAAGFTSKFANPWPSRNQSQTQEMAG